MPHPTTEPYWTNRLAQPADTAAILELVRLEYPDRPYLNEAYWRWRYLNNDGFAAQTLVADHEGGIIGIRPIAFFDFQWSQERIKGALASAVITHPDHRRRGVFRSLMKDAAEMLDREGAQVCISMPNDQSVVGYQRWADWHYAGLIPLYVKVVSPQALATSGGGRLVAGALGWSAGPLFRRRNHRQVDCELIVEQVNQVPDELDRVFDAFAGDCGVLCVRRTAAYWNWRYTRKPDAPYRTLVGRHGGELVGAVATSVQRRGGTQVGMILDLVARGGVPVLRRLVREAEADLLERQVGFITCQATSDLVAESLRGEGYRQPPLRWMPKKFHFVFRPAGAGRLPRQPVDVSDWHLMFGDSDNA